jgi:hypothetical protein
LIKERADVAAGAVPEVGEELEDGHG